LSVYVVLFYLARSIDGLPKKRVCFGLPQ